MEASIVVPFTRRVLGKETVASLLKQKTDFSYEIILVGQKEDLTKVHSAKVKKVIIPHIFLPGKTRNLGVKKAIGKYLLFIDDDCLATKDWLTKNLVFLKKQRKVGAVGGKIIGFSNKYFSRCTDYTNFWRQQNHQLRETDQLYTASLGVEKEIFNRVGGFAEEARVGEDVNFVNKLKKAGHLSYYNPQIKIFHHHQRETLPKFLQYAYQNGFHSGLYILKTHRIVERFLPLFKNFYFLLIIPMATLYTLANLYLNFTSNWQMIFFLPFIFLGYLVYNTGIAVRLIRDF